jgi:hypothetical protein
MSTLLQDQGIKRLNLFLFVIPARRESFFRRILDKPASGGQARMTE